MKIEKLPLFVIFCALCGFVSGGLPTTPGDVSFEKYYVPNWNLDHIKYINGGSEVQLLLDKNSGSGFESKGSYLFGYFSMRLKLVGGDSAGVVTAFYLCSELPDHDEIDFEFLGNRTGQPYIVQTNVFARGKGEKEQRIYLWFDPTEEYHSYSLLWNKYQIVFYVDHVPIRVFKNSKDIGVSFPLDKPMKIYSTLWEADDWVTRGGLEKIDWSKAPFVASYSSFYINGTDVSTMKSAGDQLTRGAMWWDQPEFQDLDTVQYKQLSLVRQKLTVYNYCTDISRNPTVPPECDRDKDV